jgi:uncharacterized protein (TIGR03089 family)
MPDTRSQDRPLCCAFVDSAGQTIGAIFVAAVRAEPTRPLLTYYDDASGERTELSGATLDNWVAKTANLLVDGCGLGVGDRAAVLLPPHWQAAGVLLGCWSAGLALSTAHPDVVFAALDRAADAPGALERYALGLAPMGLPLRQVPEGFADYIAEVRGHGDRFAGGLVPTSTPAIDGTTQGELCALARDRAAEFGLSAGDRVLVDAETHPDPLDWLLAPLAAGATIVLCGHLDPAALPRRRADERITKHLPAVDRGTS